MGSSNVIDLGGTSAPSRRNFKSHSTVPTVRGTNSRPAPGSRRSISAETRSTSGTNKALRAGKPVDTSSRWRARTVTREDILGRYRGTTKAHAEVDSSMLSKTRRSANAETRTSLSNGRGPVKVAETRATSKPAPAKGRALAKPTGKDAAFLRSKDPVAAGMRDLPRKDPALARQVKRGGELTSRATDLGVRATISATLPFGGGAVVSSLGGYTGGTTYDDGFDDGYYDGYGDGFNDGWYSHGGWYGPSFGLCYSWGWGFNYCWNWGWNSYWGYSGYYWSPWRSYSNWCPRPYYNSTVIYDRIIYRDRYEDDVVVAGGYEDQGEVALQGEVVDAPPMELQQSMNRAADYYLVLGDRAFRSGRYGDAVHFYAKAVEFSGDEGILYLILSDALFATGDYHYAAFALRKAIELDPNLVTSVIDKHSFYDDPMDFDRQLAVLEGYLEDHFIDTDARLVLSANYLFGGRPAAAVDLLENPFSLDVKESPAGAAILEAAKAIQHGEQK